MNSGQNRLGQLLVLARKAARPAPGPGVGPAPPGFAARVVVRWKATLGGRPSPADVFERVCWWGSSLAALVCLAAFFQYAWMPAPTSFELLLQTPPAAVTAPPP